MKIFASRRKPTDKSRLLQSPGSLFSPFTPVQLNDRFTYERSPLQRARVLGRRRRSRLPRVFPLLWAIAPVALSGMIVAILILAPEGMTAVRAALGNRLQRSVNLLFGAALTTIALTVPAVIFISLATGLPLTLGLSPANQVLLATTLLLSVVTCTTGRTNVLNGFIHLLLFVAYFTLIF